MKTMTYSKARQELATVMDETVNDHLPTVITRKNGKDCVLISKEDYDALEETAYLLRSPENAQRLVESIKQSFGTLKARQLINDE